MLFKTQGLYDFPSNAKKGDVMRMSRFFAEWSMSSKFIAAVVFFGVLFVAVVIYESRHVSKVSAASKTQITESCKRPLGEYLLRAERLLADGTQELSNVAIGYILLHNACASKQQ